mmetsp:Transcript_13950/g.25988  ORF Transcript_13950/g.25988 Transcript_13950/m.25988 type:complete len:637 (-) Transcript_13950:393-2303(-)
MINQKYHADHDTYVYIGRHVESEKIIVSFRGTSSTKHWKNNFQYGLKEVDFMKMQLPHIDESDKLEEAQYINLDVHCDSESDSESGSDDEDNEFPCHDSFSMSEKGTSGDVEYASVAQDSQSFGHNRSPQRKKRKSRRRKKRSDDHNPVDFVADTVREVGGAVLGATSTVVDATTGLLTAAVAHTPIISKTVKAFVHSGFWECYIVVREFIHETLRKELALTSPSKGKHIYFTGHSLGGVIACFAALDFTIYSKDRIDKYNRLIELRNRDSSRRGGQSSRQQWHATGRGEGVSVGMYSFGAPKPGNWMFSHVYDKIVPNSFRVVVDGDIVCGLPPTLGYQHIGTEVLIDKFCSGSIIIDPSFVERRLRTSTKNSVTAHILALYKQSLEAIRDASIYIQQIGVSASPDEDSTDGREEFNRAKQKVDSESDDHFFLEKIYGLLNKTSPDQTVDNSDAFSPLPQDSMHSIDDSGRGSLTSSMNVSIRGSTWKGSSSFGYDDTFTLNTSEHDKEEDGIGDGTGVQSGPQSQLKHSNGDALTQTRTDYTETYFNPYEKEDNDDDENTPGALSFSNMTSRPIETVLKAPFHIFSKSSAAFQKIVLGVENIRVNEDQVESMMMLQRSSMQRSEENSRKREFGI